MTESERLKLDSGGDGPLAGLRILDLTRVVMGPLATMILADQGADVIIIEDPLGDTNRLMGAGPHGELSGISLNLLRNKRSLNLNLKTSQGQVVLRRLIDTADAFVTTMRPNALVRLGIDYDAVRSVKPDIVYCQGQGWPLDSDDADFPAYDDIIQAASGIPDLMERAAGQSRLLPTIAADKVAGLVLAQAVTAALLHRLATGQGQHVEVAMTEALAGFVLTEHGAGRIADPEAPPGYTRILSPERRPHPTRDGMVQILPYLPEHYDALFRASGRDDLAADTWRYRDRRATIANSDSLYRDVREVAATWMTAGLLALCERSDIPATRVVGLSEMVDRLPTAHHHVVGDYRVIPHSARFSSTPAGLYRHAPLIGENSEQLLAELNTLSPSDRPKPGRPCSTRKEDAT